MVFINIDNVSKSREQFLSALSAQPLVYIGNVGYEERSIAFFKFLKAMFNNKNTTQRSYVLKIIDNESAHKGEALGETDKNLKEIRRFYNIKDSKIVECNLMSEKKSVGEILDSADSHFSNSYSVMLDLSTLPRRYLLEFLKKFRRCDKIQEMYIFYTLPLKYNTPLVTGNLIVQDLIEGKSLGGYGRIFITSLGLNNVQLKSCIEYVEAVEHIHAIIPYPSIIAYDVMFANKRHFDRWSRIGICDKEFVHPYDASQMIGVIKKILQHYKQKSEQKSKNVSVTLAPLSTKIHALSMFIYGLNNRTNVIYAQPKTYNVPYSYGYDKFYMYRISKSGGDKVGIKIDSGIWTGKVPK